jgi:uncharacterized protein YdhG (YjbR/CyaY superfamily)
MAERRATVTDSKQTSTKKTPATRGANAWSDDERAAMREGARERKSSAKRDPAVERAEGEREIQGKIAEMPSPDRELAERIHALVTAAAPELMPRTYYGMPAYASEGKVVCFFKPASKFKERYATFGFEAKAALDDGAVWPVAFAVTDLTAADEARLAALVKKAAG